MTFGPVIPRLDAEGTAKLLRSRGCDVPEFSTDDEATAYFEEKEYPDGKTGIQGGEHYLKVIEDEVDGEPVTKKELRVLVPDGWMRQVTK